MPVLKFISTAKRVLHFILTTMRVLQLISTAMHVLLCKQTHLPLNSHLHPHAKPPLNTLIFVYSYKLICSPSVAFTTALP